jgi:GAF domain-containing protein
MADLLPDNEAERQAALDECGILDSLPEQAYYEIVALAASICEAPIASISLIDKDREWIKAIVGVDVKEVPRQISFCAHTILKPEMMVVEGARHDSRFVGNPFVTDSPHIRFYAGMPLTIAGDANVGALCVVDVVPRELSEKQTNTLRVLAQQLSTQLELRRQLRTAG